MKLLFRPDPFKDEKGEEIELEDIEIEYIKGEGCTEDDCGYATLEISLVRTDGYISFEFSDEEDIQNEVEKIWNGGISIPVEVFKRKENKFEKLYKTKQTVDLGKLTWPHSNLHPALGRLDENSGTKLQLDLEGLKGMSEGLKVALEIIDESDLKTPSVTTYEDIIKFIEKKKDDLLNG